MKEGVIPTHLETCPPIVTEAPTAPALVLSEREIELQPSRSYPLRLESHQRRERACLPEDYPYDLTVPNTSIYVSPRNQEGLSSVVNKTLGLALKTSNSVGPLYLCSLENFQKRHRDLTHDFDISDIQNQSHHLPEFEIHDAETARKFLSLSGYTRYRVQNNGVLLVFRLPRRSAEVWKEMPKAASPQEQRSVRKSIWNRLGYEAKSQFLKNADLYNKGRDISLQRINRVGHHDPDRFYYLYEVTNS